MPKTFLKGRVGIVKYPVSDEAGMTYPVSVYECFNGMLRTVEPFFHKGAFVSRCQPCFLYCPHCFHGGRTRLEDCNPPATRIENGLDDKVFVYPVYPPLPLNVFKLGVMEAKELL